MQFSSPANGELMPQALAAVAVPGFVAAPAFPDEPSPDPQAAVPNNATVATRESVLRAFGIIVILFIVLIVLIVLIVFEGERVAPTSESHRGSISRDRTDHFLVEIAFARRSELKLRNAVRTRFDGLDCFLRNENTLRREPRFVAGASAGSARSSRMGPNMG
jgi:hypothetical protein